MKILKDARENAHNAAQKIANVVDQTQLFPSESVKNAGQIVKNPIQAARGLVEILGDTITDVVTSTLCFGVELMSVIMTDKIFSNEMSNTKQASLCLISLVTFLPMYIEQTASRNFINIIGRLLSWITLIPSDALIIYWFYKKAYQKKMYWFLGVHLTLVVLRHILSVVNVVVGILLAQPDSDRQTVYEDAGAGPTAPVTNKQNIFNSELWYQMWCYYDWIPLCNAKFYGEFKLFFLIKKMVGQIPVNFHPGIGLLYFIYLSAVQLSILIIQIKWECTSTGRNFYIIAIMIIVHNYLAEIILIIPLSKVKYQRSFFIFMLALFCGLSYILNAAALMVSGGLFIFKSPKGCISTAAKIGVGIVILIGSPLCTIAKVIATRLTVKGLIDTFTHK